MESRLIFITLLIASVNFSTSDHCRDTTGVVGAGEWNDIMPECLKKLQNQIGKELKASLTYLAMTANFMNSETYRPGIAKFFLESAIEERSHAKKLLKYLQIRGGDISSNTISTLDVSKTKWKSTKEALKDAIETEKSVTESIKKIIQDCESEKSTGDVQTSDYHTMDYLTGEFLTEQYEGTRKIIGYLSTLTRMHDDFGVLGEIIFDKTLTTSD